MAEMKGWQKVSGRVKLLLRVGNMEGSTDPSDRRKRRRRVGQRHLNCFMARGSRTRWLRDSTKDCQQIDFLKRRPVLLPVRVPNHAWAWARANISLSRLLDSRAQLPRRSLETLGVFLGLHQLLSLAVSRVHGVGACLTRSQCLLGGVESAPIIGVGFRSLGGAGHPYPHTPRQMEQTRDRPRREGKGGDRQ